MNRTDLGGTRALITGGTSGYGRALADRLAARGARVMVVGRDPGRLDAARRAGHTAVRADLTVPDDRHAAVAQACDQLGGLDLLVQSAAVQTEVDLITYAPRTTVQKLQDEVVADLLAPIAFTVEALPLLRHGSPARVAFVTSTLGFAPKRSAPAYCAAKAGLVAFALSLRRQLHHEAPTVRSTIITLPLVDTPMTAGRAQGAMSSADAARGTVRALERGRDDIDIGIAGPFRLLHRVAPGAAGRITRDA